MTNSENEIEKLLESNGKNHRLESYASRQALKENNAMNAEELESLVQNDNAVVEYAKRFIVADLREFNDLLREIHSVEDIQGKEEKIEELLFDFQTRIPDIIELLEK